jgi:hypothetical protein
MDLARLFSDIDDEAVDSPGLAAFLAHQSLVGGDLLGDITGREKLYHGTSKARAATIRREGLAPSKMTGIAEMLDEELRPPAAYMTRNKGMAKGYAAQTSKIEELLRNNPDVDPTKIVREYAASRGLLPPKHHNAEVLEARVPTWKLETMRNPELAGGGFGNFREMAGQRVRDMLPEGAPLRDFNEFVAKNIAAPANYIQFSNDRVFPDTVDAKYFKGHPEYEGLALGEVGQYAKAKPLRFLGGLGRGALGLYAGTAAARGLYDSLFGDGE